MKQSEMTSTANAFILWLAASGFALFSISHSLSGSYADGSYVPATYDSFYHARRIIDSLDAPLSVYQFDPRIHAPEGSLVTCPWLYDAALAFITGAVISIAGIETPMSVLAYIPPLWVCVNIFLLLLAARQLQLGSYATLVLLALYASSPLTLDVHAIGRLGHHYMEQSLILAALVAGLYWFRS